MKGLRDNHLQRWWIPFGSAMFFFFLLAFLIPYSRSLYEVKKSLAALIWSLSNFGQGQEDLASLDLRWTELRRAPVRQSGAGLGIIGAGILLYWVGMRAENQYFGYLSLQILLAGVILWLWGWSVFRIVLFPWAFFMFAWPVPFLDPIIAFPLRMDMSAMASYLLPLMGIPCVRNGTGLLSPPDVLHNIPMGAQFRIDIADPCSGIRSLFALMMFSALFGYLFLPRWWQQWIIFLSAFPVAVLGNLVRVVMLVLASIFFGSAFAIGTDKPSWFHEGCGFLVYAVALGAEVLLASLLTRKWTPSAEVADDRSHAAD
jgi:exosortase